MDLTFAAYRSWACEQTGMERTKHAVYKPTPATVVGQRGGRITPPPPRAQPTAGIPKRGWPPPRRVAPRSAPPRPATRVPASRGRFGRAAVAGKAAAGRGGGLVGQPSWGRPDVVLSRLDLDAPPCPPAVAPSSMKSPLEWAPWRGQAAR